MTFAMSSETEEVKNSLPEGNEKIATDNHTDTSQDSTDANEKPTKEITKNDIDTKAEPLAPKAETEDSEQDSECSEKKDDSEVKKEESDKPKEEAKDNGEAEVEKKKPTKSVEEKSEESEKEEEEEEDAENEDDSEKDKKKDTKKGVPLLDQPLETTGKRERKGVQRLEVAAEAKEVAKIEFEKGSGTPLGDIPRIEASITRFKNEDLKILHKILFKLTGKPAQIKKNIKKFNGFEFKKTSDDYKKKLASLHKLDLKHLKSICEMLDLEKKGTKDEICERILDFLMEPKDSGKPVGGGRPKRASAIRANNRGYSSHDDYSSDEKHSRAKRDKGKRPNLKDESSSEEFQPENSDASADDKPKVVSKRKRGRAKKKQSSDEEASVSGASSEDSDFEEGPKMKRRKSVTKSSSKATPQKRGRGRGRPKSTGKKTPGRKPRRRDSSAEEGSESEHEKDGGTSSSEDEPLAKKVKSTEPPTDEEIKTFIKSILEGANLEEITMKTVCQRVYDNYPDFDLSHKKDFIKTTVKSLIST